MQGFLTTWIDSVQCQPHCLIQKEEEILVSPLKLIIYEDFFFSKDFRTSVIPDFLIWSIVRILIPHSSMTCNSHGKKSLMANKMMSQAFKLKFIQILHKFGFKTWGKRVQMAPVGPQSFQHILMLSCLQNKMWVPGQAHTLTSIPLSAEWSGMTSYASHWLEYRNIRSVIGLHPIFTLRYFNSFAIVKSFQTGCR